VENSEEQEGEREGETTDEDDDSSVTSEDQRDVEEGGKNPAVPWHHAQLYQMYGKEADYFLYPTIDLDKLAGNPTPALIKSDHGIIRLCSYYQWRI